MVTPETLPTPAEPADILIAGWDRGKPAALDLTITSPLCSAILSESCHQTGAAALAAEVHKLHSNGPKCQELYCYYYYYGCLLLNMHKVVNTIILQQLNVVGGTHLANIALAFCLMRVRLRQPYMVDITSFRGRHS